MLNDVAICLAEYAIVLDSDLVKAKGWQRGIYKVKKGIGFEKVLPKFVED